MRILISAGPTREYIDPIRFISNPSTGKMGYILAEYALKAGHSVILVSGPVKLKPPGGAVLLRVETAEEMKDAVLENFPGAEVLIMSAAVGDWKPLIKEKDKVKRKKRWLLELVPNPDILKEAAKIKKKGQKVIGFALETENLVNNARKKLEEKKLDLIVADTPAFFGSSRKSDVIFIHKDGMLEKFAGISKRDVARKIIGIINDCLL
ncbi:MAG TPA: phosphopantothenoylcysteine decarboxylase [bacterium]|nr:phosphopantothenoylcysteine decarboxylase [bacterium]